MDGIELFCDDELSTSTLVFHVVDAATGLEVERFDLRYRSGGTINVGIGGLRSGAPALADHADTGELPVERRGGRLRAFLSGISATSRLRRRVPGSAAVQMHRGWCAQLLVTDATTGDTLEGADIVIAGEVCTTTDANGDRSPALAVRAGRDRSAFRRLDARGRGSPGREQ